MSVLKYLKRKNIFLIVQHNELCQLTDLQALHINNRWCFSKPIYSTHSKNYVSISTFYNRAGLETENSDVIC